MTRHDLFMMAFGAMTAGTVMALVAVAGYAATRLWRRFRPAPPPFDTPGLDWRLTNE